jgi:PhnB protein
MSENIKKDSVFIAPLLSVPGGASAIGFYQRAFDAEELFRVEDGKGEVVARLAVHGAEFWLADESPPHENFSPETLGGSTSMVVVVEDPKSLFEQAVAAGAKIVSPVSAQHGWVVGRMMDPFGHHWEIGKLE